MLAVDDYDEDKDEDDLLVLLVKVVDKAKDNTWRQLIYKVKKLNVAHTITVMLCARVARNLTINNGQGA